MAMISMVALTIDTLKPKQNGRHLPDDIFKYILNGTVQISIKTLLNSFPKGPIPIIPALV